MIILLLYILSVNINGFLKIFHNGLNTEINIFLHIWKLKYRAGSLGPRLYNQLPKSLLHNTWRSDHLCSRCLRHMELLVYSDLFTLWFKKDCHLTVDYSAFTSHTITFLGVNLPNLLVFIFCFVLFVALNKHISPKYWITALFFF